MRLWDTCAISSSLADVALAAKFRAAFLNQEVSIAGHIILELTAGAPTDEQKQVVAALLAQPGMVQMPEAEDYRRAGEWLGKLPSRKITKKKCPNCRVDLKPGKGELKDARFRDTFDAVLASVAWSRSLPVVTINPSDFEQFKSMIQGAIIEKPEDVLKDPPLAQSFPTS